MPTRLRWPVLGVLISLFAGATEAVVIIASVLRTNPRWDVFIPTNRAAILTCVACVGFSVAGLAMKPRARLGALFACAALVALLALLYTLFVEFALRIKTS